MIHNRELHTAKKISLIILIFHLNRRMKVWLAPLRDTNRAKADDNHF